MVIIDYYKKLDKKSKKRFIRDVIDLTDMGYSTFHMRLKDNSFRKLEKEAIINYIKKREENGRQD